MGTQRLKITKAVLGSKARITLTQIARLEGPVRATELIRPRTVVSLAQHGYVTLTVELTDKGRRALGETEPRPPTPDDPDDYGGGQIVTPEDGRR